MKRGSFFLSLAAGLLASLAFTTPSEAGAVVTTALAWTGLSPAAASIEIDYSAGTGAISNFMVLGGTPYTRSQPPRPAHRRGGRHHAHLQPDRSKGLFGFSV